MAEPSNPKIDSNVNLHSVPVILSKTTIPITDDINNPLLGHISVQITMPSILENKSIESEQIVNDLETPGKSRRNELRKIDANWWNAVSSGALISGFIVPFISL